MRRLVQVVIGLAVAGAALVAGVVGVRALQTPYPHRFAEVVPGRIYRSAQPNYRELEVIKRETGIRAIINLRGAGGVHRDGKCQEEARFAAEKGINLVVIAFRDPPTDENITKLLEVLDDEKNYPVLIHCARGIERTGIAVAVYRMERQGWTSGQAVREMTTNAFARALMVPDNYDETIFVSQYQPRRPAQEKKP